MHIHVHTLTHIHVRTHMHTHAHTCTHTYTNTGIHRVSCVVDLFFPAVHYPRDKHLITCVMNQGDGRASKTNPGYHPWPLSSHNAAGQRTRGGGKVDGRPRNRAGKGGKRGFSNLLPTEIYRPAPPPLRFSRCFSWFPAI